MLRRLTRNHSIEICTVTRTLELDTVHLEQVQRFAKVNLFPCPPETVCPHSSSFLVQRNASPEAMQFVSSRLALGDIDLVHCEGFYMRSLLQETNVPTFLMEQNVEYLAWPGSMEQIRFEEEIAWRSSTLCGAVTEDDAMVMRQVIPFSRVSVCFNGGDHQTLIGNERDLTAETLPIGPIVLCVGNFAYGPSYDAGAMMCSLIAPRVLEQNADTTVLIVGNESESLASHVVHERCIIVGRVPSLEPYYSAATVVAFPVERGRGVSVKIMEALVRGCAVLTTEVGKRSLVDAPVAVANGMRQFAEQLGFLISDRRAREELQAAAIRFGPSIPTWDMAAEQLERSWERAIRVEKNSD